MLAVVLDANTVGVQDPLAGNASRIVLDAASKGQLLVVVPELVIREVINKWRENTAGEIDKLRPLIKRLERYRLSVDLPTDEDLAARATDVEGALRQRLAAPGVLTPNFPVIGHEHLVQRALDRRLPFTKDGKDGYRDSVLWETVIELAAKHEVVLVSRDGRAFTSGDDKETLSQALAAEVLERLGDGAHVELVRDLQAVADRVTAQDEHTLQAVRSLVSESSFRTLLEEALEDNLPSLSLGPRHLRTLGFGPQISIGTAMALNELGAVSVLSAYAVPGGDTLAELDVAASIDAHFIVTGADALQFRSRTDVWPGQGEWEDIDPYSRDVVLVTAGYGRMRIDLAVAMPDGRITRLQPIEWRFLETGEAHEPAPVPPDEWADNDDGDS